MNKINDTVIKNCISANIKNLNSVFVFPTQISASMWADKALEFSGAACVALERFIAWDEFKGESIRSQHQDKNSIPSTLRTIFAENLILQNSISPFLKSIITQEFAQSATRFSIWIAKILPSLSMWKNNIEKKNIIVDEEDQDFLEVYKRYKEFLDNNNLFDPAWETPPFKPDGNKYFIFFPEILMDYAEYQDILESSDDITVIHIDEDSKKAEKPDGHFYANSRVELKDVMHYLWNIHNDKNVPWNKIAISVPDMDTYGPYLERDLDRYEIPHVLRTGRPLSANGAGLLFSQLRNCCSEDFSYDSIKTLLLNKELPWKEPAAIDMLINFGRENNCLCSYEYNEKKIDVWKESFKYPVDSSSVERIEPLYKDLIFFTEKIVKSKSFSEIRTNYFLFREKFFDFAKEDFPPENDKILSRCISELGGLIDLEEKFTESGIFNIPSFYNFFCDYLDGIMYVPQNSSRGVQILPFKTAACAPFDVHVIVDASQNNTSVVYKQLSFLRDDKRKVLGFVNDSNITESFILLYAMNSQKDVFFTCSEKTIDAYAFTNSYLNQVDHRPYSKSFVPGYAENDPFTEELDAYLSDDKRKLPEKLFRVQKEGFDNWEKCERSEQEIIPSVKKSVSEKIDNALLKNGKISVTVSDLKRFYECPRSFLLGSVFDVYKEDSAATLVNKYAIGNLYHWILEKYFTALKDKNMSLMYDLSIQSIPNKQKEMLIDSVKYGIESFHASHLAVQLYKSSMAAIENVILNAVNIFSKTFNGYMVREIEKDYESYEDDFIFKTRIDCMLVSPDGELVIVDFKSTKNGIPYNAFWDGQAESVPNFQLPVYKYVVDKKLKQTQKISACVFFGIRDAEFFVMYSDIDDIKVKDDVNENFLMTQNRCLELAKKYADYARKHEFSPALLKLSYSACSGCDYKSICRRIFTVSPAWD